jgi:hypothetical protein
MKGSASTAASFALGPMIVPRHVLGGVGYRAPSDTLNVAMVGIGGMGMSNFAALVAAGVNIVAICDADFAYVERSLANRMRPAQGQSGPSASALALQAAYTKAAKYGDFRVMLDKQRDIEAVSIATPDHLHAVIAYAAMKAGKHVYVQKPLTYSVQEARILAKTARDTKVVTQMGNQGHSMDGTRRIVELIGAGHSASPSARNDGPTACAECGAAVVEHADGGPRSAGGDGRQSAGHSRGPRLGSLPRTCEGRSLSPGLPSVQLAWMGGLRCERHRRHGCPPD